MSQSEQDAILVSSALATRFLFTNRRELRNYTGLSSTRLYRAILQCERKGILLSEYRGGLAIAERLYNLRNT